MIRFILILAIIISIACGSYALLLLGRLRRIYNLDYISSFLYYEFLKLGFGLYGIMGGLAIKEILLKYDLQSGQIESIVIALPFFGVPFIIAAWYLLIKMAHEMSGKKIRQSVTIVYFILTTLFFLVYGLILRGSPEKPIIDPLNISQAIRIVFYSIDLLVKLYVVILLLQKSLKLKNTVYRVLLRRLLLILSGITIMNSLALHFASVHPLIGIYFILLFFGGDLIMIILLKAYLHQNSAELGDVTDKLENLYQHFGISKRERDIITEICGGFTNQQIADKLFISLQTVKDHTHNIFKKVNVSNRVQLTQIFLSVK
jgi:DNA-binding CsgD family transcriptional regulator